MIDLQNIDHVHIYVRDRSQSETWYANFLGLRRAPGLEFWAKDGGPLTLQNESGSIHLALFESASVQNTTVAFKTSAASLAAWIEHFRSKGVELAPVDHDLSWSIYFKDPDGNPYEITSYDYEEFSSLQLNS